MHDSKQMEFSGTRKCSTCGQVVPPDAPENLCPNCLLESGLRTPDSVAAEQSTSGHGASFVAPSPAKLADQFSQLEIIELLGQGGMGAVYKARQKKLDRLVALKILPLESGNTPAFTERFNREARALARLSHPNIITIHDYGEVGGLFYFIMEYVDGRNLRQLMHLRQLSPQDSLEIIPQICDALQYAHDEGVVHRDIKPENIMIDKKGRVKIADFGLAKLLHKDPIHFTLTGSRQMMGTPHYMAPEQMERPLEVDHRADIFSLGVVFYELLTSELPLGRFAPPSQKVRIDRRLDDVVLRALTKEPEQRYQRVSDMKSAVDRVVRGGPLRGADLRSPYRPALQGDTTPADIEMIRMEVQGPIAGLMLTSIVAFISWFLIATIVTIMETSSRYTDEVPIVICWVLAISSLLPNAVMTAGALKMRQFQGYEHAMLASILAMLPWSPAWVIGIGMGGWSLGVLRRREVRAAFILTADPQSKARSWITPPPEDNPAPGADPISPVSEEPNGFRAFLHSVRNYWFTSATPPNQRPE